MKPKFRQKRGGYKASFDFGEEELTYTFDNSRTKVGSTIPYHKIPDRASYREVRMWWLQYAIVFYLTFCAITAMYYFDANDYPWLMGVLYFSTLLFLCATLTGLMFHGGGITSLPLNPVLSILHDGQQHVVLEELMKRRHVMMQEKLAQIDTNRPYYEEASKFSWLKEEGIITEEEYHEARLKITAMRDKGGPLPHGPGNVN